MKNLTTDRIVAFLLIAVEAMALAFMSRHFTFALCVIAAALGLLPGWVRWNLKRVQIQTLALILVLVFAVKSRWVSPNHFPGNSAFLTYAYGYAVAQFCITLQVALCLALPGARRRHGLVLLLGALAMIYAGNKYTVFEERELYRVFSLAFIVLSGVYLTTCAQRPLKESAKRPAVGRAYFIAAALVLAALTAWKTGSFLIAAEPYASRFLSQLQWGGETGRFGAGFSSESVLESIRHWKRSEENAMALRVVSSRPPGYLRGRAFLFFDGRKWTAAKKGANGRTEKPLQGAPDLPIPFPEERFFDIGEIAIEEIPTEEPKRTQVPRKKKAENYWEMQIHPLQEIEEILFASLGARFLGADLDFANVSGTGAVSSVVLPKDGKYRVFVPDHPATRTLEGADREDCLGLPMWVHPRVLALSKKVFRGCQTPREKMQAVERFFRRNFAYELNAYFAQDPRKDLLTYFLLERPPAHCEYFATGSAVLLRLADVPCRYITGFVCEEKNTYGNYWVARNRDAHAWVEAWDDERGWAIVESTPPEGIPGRSKRLESSSAGQIWDTFKFYLSKTKAAIKAGMFKQRLLGLLETLIWKTLYLRTLPGFLIAVGLLALAVIYLFRIRRGRAAAPEDPLVLALHQCLRAMDRRLARRDFRRKPSETLHQFAERITAAGREDSRLQQASQWYQRYAVLRYGGGLNLESARGLREAMEWRN